jgi:hypothetical protein
MRGTLNSSLKGNQWFPLTPPFIFDIGIYCIYWFHNRLTIHWIIFHCLVFFRLLREGEPLTPPLIMETRNGWDIKKWVLCYSLVSIWFLSVMDLTIRIIIYRLLLLELFLDLWLCLWRWLVLVGIGSFNRLFLRFKERERNWIERGERGEGEKLKKAM